MKIYRINIWMVAFVVAALFGSGQLHAQSFTEDYTAMMKRYASAKLFYTAFEVNIFTNASDNKPGHTKKGTVKKYHQSFVMNLDQITTLINDEIYLVKNAMDYEISFSLRDSTQNISNFLPYETEMDSFVLNVDSIRYLGKSGNTRSYAIYKNQQLIDKTIISFNVATKALAKLEYYYNKSFSFGYDKVVIRYSQTSFAPGLNSREFRSDYYVNIDGKEIKASNRFPAYRVRFIDPEGTVFETQQ